MEGPAGSSKSAIAVQALFWRVWSSETELHCIAGQNLGSIKDNLLYGDIGLLTQFTNYCTWKTDPVGSPYIHVKGYHGWRKILLAGFGNVSAWKGIVGKKIETFLVDEINLADDGFIDEMIARQGRCDYPLTIGTLNGDDPDHKIYQRINQSKIVGDAPSSIRSQMEKTYKKDGYYYFHYGLRDNPYMSVEKIRKFGEMYPVGSHYYITRFLGERGVAEGAVFAEYLKDTMITNLMRFESTNKYGKKENKIIKYSIGVDIGNNDVGSSKSIIVLTGLTEGFHDVVFINSYECRSIESEGLINEWVTIISDYCKELDVDGIFVDGFAVSQLLMNTLERRLKQKGIFVRVEKAFKFGEEAGRKERMQLMYMLIGQGRVWWCDKRIYDMFKKLIFSTKEKGFIEDKNEIQNDYYDASMYSITYWAYEIKEGV
jgi:hypothetical protein